MFTYIPRVFGMPIAFGNRSGSPCSRTRQLLGVLRQKWTAERRLGHTRPRMVGGGNGCELTTLANSITEEIPTSVLEPLDQWQKKEIPLRYRFGGRQIFSVNRPAIVHGRYPFLAEPTLAQEYPKDMMREQGVELALIPDCLLADGNIPSLSFVSGGARYIPSRHISHSFAIEGDFSDFLDRTMSKKSRSTIERKIRRCAREFGGKLTVKEYGTPEEIEQFYQVASQISDLSYQERLLKIGLPNTDEFRSEMTGLAQSDTLRCYLLFGDERPLAYLYLPNVEKTVMVYQYMGYDPEFKKLSTGAVLQHLAFERIFASKCTKYFDFMPGDGAHKALYGNRKEVRGDVYFLGPKLANGLYVSTHRFTDWANQQVSNTLKRAGIKGLVKKHSREIFIGAGKS